MHMDRAMCLHMMCWTHPSLHMRYSSQLDQLDVTQLQGLMVYMHSSLSMVVVSCIKPCQYCSSIAGSTVWYPHNGVWLMYALYKGVGGSAHRQNQQTLS